MSISIIVSIPDKREQLTSTPSRKLLLVKVGIHGEVALIGKTDSKSPTGHFIKPLTCHGSITPAQYKSICELAEEYCVWISQDLSQLSKGVQA